jgi:uncharacterized membrane protein YebE (DUF533 family)
MRELSIQELSAAHGGGNIISDTWASIFDDGLTNAEIGLLGFGAVGGFFTGIVVGNQSVVTIVSVAALLGAGYLGYEWYIDKDTGSA